MKQVIKAIWLEELKLETVKDDDDFFDLGGHSLIMARIQARLKENLGVEASMEQLFSNPTINQLTDALSLRERQPA